jgi:hypothetical protein
MTHHIFNIPCIPTIYATVTYVHICLYLYLSVRLFDQIRHQGDSEKWKTAFPQLGNLPTQEMQKEYARNELFQKMTCWMSNKFICVFDFCFRPMLKSF